MKKMCTKKHVPQMIHHKSACYAVIYASIKDITICSTNILLNHPPKWLNYQYGTKIENIFPENANFRQNVPQKVHTSTNIFFKNLAILHNFKINCASFKPLSSHKNHRKLKCSFRRCYTDELTISTLKIGEISRILVLIIF